MNKQKKLRIYPPSLNAVLGGLLGTAGSLAVSAFKGSGIAGTVGSAALAAAVCAWGFGKAFSEKDRRRTSSCMILAVLFAAFSVIGFCFAMDSTPERLYASKGIFAAFSVIGFCFAMDSTPERLYASKGSLLKAAGAFCGYTLIFHTALSGLFRWLKERQGRAAERIEGEKHGYAGLLTRRPFPTAFCTLLIGYLPYMIVSYPALFMGDCQTIIPQGFGASPLTTHHPVPYTLFLCGVLRAGKDLLSSWNAGAFLFALIQTLFFLAVMAYSIQVLIQKAGCSWKWALALEVWYVLGPRISNCMFVITKDVWYAACLLLFGASVFCVQREGWTRKNIIQLALSAVGILCFRKDGFYVLLLSFAVYLLFSRKLRKGMPVFLIAVLGLHFSYLIR